MKSITNDPFHFFCIKSIIKFLTRVYGSLKVKGKKKKNIISHNCDFISYIQISKLLFSCNYDFTSQSWLLVLNFTLHLHVLFFLSEVETDFHPFLRDVFLVHLNWHLC